jgi:hypothetical protein
MLAAIILKLGRIADRVDPQPSDSWEPPSWRTWEGIKDWFWEGVGLLIAIAMVGGLVLLVG